MKRMGREKLHFALLELAKHRKGPSEQIVPTNFLDNVVNSQMHQCIAFVNLNLELFSKNQAFI